MKEGIISQETYIRLVDEMDRVEPESISTLPEPASVSKATAKEMVTSLCGVERPAGNSIRMHERKCKKCIRIREEKTEAS